jgi:hypothetical protein
MFGSKEAVLGSDGSPSQSKTGCDEVHLTFLREVAANYVDHLGNFGTCLIVGSGYFRLRSRSSLKSAVKPFIAPRAAASLEENRELRFERNGALQCGQLPLNAANPCQ